MAHEFRFPDVGEGITEGEIVAWKVRVGDRVEEHQAILEVETDKAVVEIPAPVAGVIVSLRGGPGDVVRVGDVLAVIGDGSAAERAPAVREPAGRPEAPAPIPIPGGRPRAPRQAPGVAGAPRRESVGVVGELEEAPDEEEVPAPLSAPRVELLPRDRALARRLGVDPRSVRGTGPGGRITEADLRKAAERGAPERGLGEAPTAPGSDEHGPVERVAVRGVRRKIAEAMVRSLGRAAQVTTVDEADVGLLHHIREKEKAAAAEQGVRLTFLPFVVKAVVGALRRDPYLNAVMDEDRGEIVVKGYYHVGVAVETRDGLIVPNVKDADKKSILAIGRELQDLAERARRRTLTLSEVKGGTFTITNFGAIGGLYATPILNDPEVAILGVGRVHEKPVAEGGALKVGKVMPLSLTFDHRVVDGATAQHFLNNVVRHLEDPDLLLLGG